MDRDGTERRGRVLPPPSLQSNQSTISTNYSFPNPPVPPFIHRSNTKDSAMVSETTTPPGLGSSGPWSSSDGFVYNEAGNLRFPHNQAPGSNSNKKETIEPEMSSNPTPDPTPDPIIVSGVRKDEEEPSMASTAGSRYYEIDFQQGQAQVQKKKRSPERIGTNAEEVGGEDTDPKETPEVVTPEQPVQTVSPVLPMQRDEHQEERMIANQYFGVSSPPQNPIDEFSHSTWEHVSATQYSTSTAMTGPAPLPTHASQNSALRMRAPSDITMGVETQAGYSASISEGPPTHRHTLSDASSMFMGPLGTQIRGPTANYLPSGSIARSPSSESKLPQLSVADKSTVKAPKVTSKPTKCKLLEGRFSLDDGSTRRFVYVPSKFNFRTKEGFDSILQALGMEKPDVVFQVGECYSLVPNQNANEVRAYYQELRPHNYEGSPQKWIEREDLKFPHPSRDYFEILTRCNRVHSIMDTIATACHTTSSSVFVLNAPHRGNELAESACASAHQKGVTSLGLFCDEEFTCLDSSEDSKEEESVAEFQQIDMNQLIHRGFEVPWEKYWSKRRQKVPKDLFKEKDFVTEVGEEPNETMQIHCERSPSEKAFREHYRFNVIRNGLADACSKLLVFETRESKEEFHKIFTRLYNGGIIVGGSKVSVLDQAFECLQGSRPIFVLQNTGATSNAVAELVKFGQRIGDFKTAGAQLSHPKFVDPLAVDSYIENHFPPYDRRSELAIDDNIWEYARVVAHTFLGSAPHFNPRSNAIFDVGSYIDVDRMQDDVTRVITSISERAPELGGPAKDLQALSKAKAMSDELAKAKRRYRFGGTLVQITIRFMIVAAILFAVTQTAVLDEDENRTAYQALRSFTVILPLVGAVLITLEATIRPGLKYALLLLAEKRIESETFRFRTRTGIYKGNNDRESTRGARSRTVFMERCEEIIESCFESDVGTGSLFAMTTKKDDIAGLFSQTESSSWPREAVQKMAKKKGADDGWTQEKDRISWLPRFNKPGPALVPTETNEHDIEDSGQPNPRHLNVSSVSRNASAGPVSALESVLITADGYLEKRIVNQLSELHSEAPYLATIRLYLKFFVIILTVSSSALASFNQAQWIPVPLALAAALELTKDYMQLDTRVPTVNGAAGELIKVWLWWTGLSLAQTRITSNKDELVDRAERAILAQYEHYAGQVISSLRGRRDQQAPHEAETGEKKAPIKPDNEDTRFQEVTSQQSSFQRGA